MEVPNIRNMNLISEVLNEKGIKQTWLAEKIGKSYNMVNSYVQNRRQPSIEILHKIAYVLEVKPSLLINDKYKESPFCMKFEDLRDDFHIGHERR